MPQWKSALSGQESTVDSTFGKLGEALKLISQKAFLESSCKSKVQLKLVNLFFILVIINDKLTDLCAN